MKKAIVGVMLFVLLLSGCSNGPSAAEEYAKRVSDAQAKLAKDTCFQYHYEKLSKKEKEFYALMYEGMKKGDKTFYVNSKKDERLDDILIYVLNDHPELYYVSMGYASPEDDKSKMVMAYNENKKIKKDRNRQLKETFNEVQAQVNDTMSDYDKVKLVYDYVIARNEYVDDAKNNQNIISSLVDRKTVCAGYARAAQYLLNKLGVKTTYITGEILDPEEGENASHAWNLVNIDGNYFYFDATWGDQVESDNTLAHPCYSYFMMSKQEMERLYKPDVKVEETPVYDNLFTRTQTYINAYDEGVLASAFRNAMNTNATLIEVKFSDESYDYAKQQLFGDASRVFNVLESIGLYQDNVTYREDDTTKTIEIYL